MKTKYPLQQCAKAHRFRSSRYSRLLSEKSPQTPRWERPPIWLLSASHSFDNFRKEGEPKKVTMRVLPVGRVLYCSISVGKKNTGKKSVARTEAKTAAVIAASRGLSRKVESRSSRSGGAWQEVDWGLALPPGWCCQVTPEMGDDIGSILPSLGTKEKVFRPVIHDLPSRQKWRTA